MIQLSESTSGWVMIGTIAVGGALGGVLFMSLFSLAAFLLGAAGGLAGGFTVVTLPFAANWGSTVKLIVVVAFVVLGFGVAYLVKKPLLIISTAVIGSFAVFSGIDYFTQTGFGSLLVNDKSRVEFNNGKKLSNQGFIGMMAGYAVVAMVSASVHFHLDRKKRGAVSAKYAPAKKEIV